MRKKEKNRGGFSAGASSFRQALLSGLPAVLPYFGAMLMLVTVFTFSEIEYLSDSGAGQAAAALKDIKQFLLLSADVDFTSIFLPLCALTAPALLGIVLFRFMASKRTVNVYYSLGLSRSALFLTRYLAGAVLLIAASLIPVAANLVKNLCVFGSCAALWAAAASLFAGLAILATLSFSVTAAVFSAVGTVGEGAVYSIALLLSPTVLLAGAEAMMSRIWGNPFGATFSDMDGSYTANSLLLRYKGFQPLFFLQESVGQACEQQVGEAWAAPRYAVLLLWAAVALGAAGLALWSFRRRKAEICGFLGVNSALNGVVTALAGFLCFGAVIRLCGALPDYAAILLGLLIYAVVFCIFYLVLMRDRRRFFKKLRFLPLHLAAMALLGVITITGLMGFSSHVPAYTEVQSVAVTMPSQSIQITGYMSMRGTNNFCFTAQGDLIEGFTSARDLQFIEKLHRQMVECEKQALREDGPRKEQVVRMTTQFSYLLKNGRQVKRSYDRIPVSVLAQFLQLEDSDRYHALIQELLTTAPDPDSHTWLTSSMERIQAGEEVLVSGKWLTSEQKLTLSREQRRELLQCIASDLCAQPAAERYHPSTPALGAIYLAGEEEDTVSGKAGRKLAGELSTPRLPVTSGMKHTLAFLQEHGGQPLLQETASLKKLSVIRANADWPSDPMVTQGSFPYETVRYTEQSFRGGWTKSGLKGEFYVSGGPDPGAFQSALIIRDQETIQKMMQHAYLNYFLDTEGYYILAEFEEERGSTVFFLPADEAPELLRQALS